MLTSFFVLYYHYYIKFLIKGVLVMKKLIGALAILAIMGLSSPANAYESAVGHLNALIGQKSLAKSEWVDVNSQFKYSIDGDFKVNELPFHISLAYVHSQDSVSSLDGETTELRLGIRKYLDSTSDDLAFFIGGGLANIHAKAVYIGVTTVDDSTLGYYAEVGGQYMIQDTFYIGAKVDLSVADVKHKNGAKIEAGGTQYGLYVGVPF